MKRIYKFLFVFIFGLIVPGLVFAVDQDDDILPDINLSDTSHVTLCQNGCDFSNLDTLLREFEDDNYLNLHINVKDSYEYTMGDHNLSNTYVYFTSSNNSNINISGASDNTRLSVYGLQFYGYDNPVGNFTVKLKNLNIYTNTNYCDSDMMGMCPSISIGANSMIDNITVNGRYSGLAVIAGKSHTINKYTFNGNNYGVIVGNIYNSPIPLNSVTITNSKLANCNCSLAVYDLDFNSHVRKANIDDINNITLKKIAFTNYNVKVDSSEVNCAKYGADYSSIATNPTIYFTSNNDWKAAISRGTDFNSFANIVEGYNSRIIIDMEKKDTIKLSSKVSLQNYFDELKDVDPGDIQWRVANPKILKIENGKVIPLKIGTTTVTATYKNNNYSIEFRVTGLPSININNPKTGASLFLIFSIIFTIGVITYSIVSKQIKKLNN